MDAGDLGSDDYIGEAAYLVERGVRPMSIVGHLSGDAAVLLAAASRLEILSSSTNVVPFVVRRRDGWADCGFAAAAWVVDLYEWLVRDTRIPEKHAHAIRGLLLGYGVGAIRAHGERDSGRRFCSLDNTVDG